jgi:hypothetical protein
MITFQKACERLQDAKAIVAIVKQTTSLNLPKDEQNDPMSENML